MGRRAAPVGTCVRVAILTEDPVTERPTVTSDFTRTVDLAAQAWGRLRRAPSTKEALLESNALAIELNYIPPGDAGGSPLHEALLKWVQEWSARRARPRQHRAAAGRPHGAREFDGPGLVEYLHRRIRR